jgi:hypothetical protein
MTLFYQTTSNGSSDKELWKHLTEKKNWRITQLPNKYFQTEYLCLYTKDYWRSVTRRNTILEAEAAIDETIDYYIDKLNFIDGPKVVKTFK